MDGKGYTINSRSYRWESGNNYPDNMRMICPNCDAQLPTYMGRNRKNSMKTGRERRRKTNSI